MRDMIGETRFDLIDRLIAEQQYLSAVERFAQKHEQAKLPLQAKYYRDLIPLTKPGKDQQYYDSRRSLSDRTGVQSEERPQEVNQAMLEFLRRL
jgi:hypothetical protein